MSINYGTEYDLTVLQNNDETIPLTYSDGFSPYNLSGLTLTFYLKASDTASDGSAVMITPTVIAELLGQLSVTIPHSDLATAGIMFYHLDASNSGVITTLSYGAVNILPI